MQYRQNEHIGKHVERVFFHSQLCQLGATTEELFGIPCNCDKADMPAADEAPPWARELMRRVDQLEQRNEGNKEAM